MRSAVKQPCSTNFVLLPNPTYRAAEMGSRRRRWAPRGGAKKRLPAVPRYDSTSVCIRGGGYISLLLQWMPLQCNGSARSTLLSHHSVNKLLYAFPAMHAAHVVHCRCSHVNTSDGPPLNCNICSALRPKPTDTGFFIVPLE